MEPWKTIAADRCLVLQLEPGLKAIGPLRLSGDQPHRDYEKELIRLGDYWKDSEGLGFRVTPAWLDNWVRQFKQMKVNGLRVPVPFKHVTPKKELALRKGDPRDNGGWVTDIIRRGRSLFMRCRLFGKDAIEAAQRSDVSLFSPPKFVDGKGRVYVMPITHVAMVTDPVVPGLEEFKPIAASLAFRQSKESRMDLEWLKELAELLGIDPESITDEETGKDEVLQALQQFLSEEHEEAQEEPEQEAAAHPGKKLCQGQKMSRQKLSRGPMGLGKAPAAEPGAEPGADPTTSEGNQPQVARPKPGAVTSEKIHRTFAASRQAIAASQSPMVNRVIAENRELRLDALLTAGKITPQQHERLVKRWCAPQVISLALSQNSDGSDFDELEATLSENIAFSFGDNSARQMMADARKHGQPDEAEKADKALMADAEKRAQEHAKRFGGKA